MVIYPGGVVKRGTAELSPEIRVTPQTPPCFFAQAHDDRVNAENSVAMYLALKRAGVSAELHIYAPAATASACGRQASRLRRGPTAAAIGCRAGCCWDAPATLTRRQDMYPLTFSG